MQVVSFFVLPDGTQEDRPRPSCESPRPKEREERSPFGFSVAETGWTLFLPPQVQPPSLMGSVVQIRLSDVISGLHGRTNIEKRKLMVFVWCDSGGFGSSQTLTAAPYASTKSKSLTRTSCIFGVERAMKHKVPLNMVMAPVILRAVWR